MSNKVDVFTKRSILSLSIFTITFLATCQDLFLAESLGEIFRSPVVLISPLFFISEYYLLHTKGQFYNRVSNVYLYFHLIYFVVTIIYIALWLITGNAITFLGENIFLKAVKQLLYYSFFWGLFRCFYLLLTQAEKYEIKTDRIFVWLICMYTLIPLWEVTHMPTAFTFFHALPEYRRVRLLTSEASSTGSVAILLLAGLCLGKKNNFKILAAIVFFLVFILTSSSKTFLVGIAFSFLILNFKLVKKYKTTAILGLAIAVIGFYYLILPDLLFSFAYDIDNATSVTTRSLWYVSSIRSLYMYPIGTGGISAFYFLKVFKNSIQAFTQIFPELNYREALGLGTDSLKAVQAGSTFGNFVVILGIPGLWLLIRLLKTLVKAAKGNALLSAFVIYFIITNLTTESMENKFTYAIFFAVIAYLADQKIKKQVIQNENIISVA